MLGHAQLPATALLSELHWLPVNSRMTFKLACLTYKLLTTPVNLLICVLRSLLLLYTHSTNQFSLTCRDFPLNLVQDHLVTGLLQSGMD